MVADLAVQGRGLWTVAETADRLGVPRAQVEDCLAAGDLSYVSAGDRTLVPASAVRGLVGLIDDAMACCRPGRVLDGVVMPLAQLGVFCELLEIAEDVLSASQTLPDLLAVDPIAELVGCARRLAPVVERVHAHFADWGGA